MKRIKDILEKVYTNEELRKTVVPLFIGNPGLGKTVFIEEFAKEKGVELVELITSQMSPFEISGIAMPDKDLKKMIYYNFDRLENLKDGDILFFDELLNGNPIVLNACLTILEQRKFISGKPLPNIMIIAAANPQGMSPLTPQIKERFVWYDVKFDGPMWTDYMIKKYGITSKIGRKLVSLIKEETFTSNNFYTPRSIDKAVNMIIHAVDTPYQNVLKPILSEAITNKFDKPIVLSKTRKLEPNEMISWLEVIRIKRNILVEETIKANKVEDFILPEQWFIRIDSHNFNEVYSKYFNNKASGWSNTTGYGISESLGRNHWIADKIEIPDNFKEISLEEFRKHVLNK
jgi:hypothetical protein